MTTLRFHGHACFVLNAANGESLAVDPVPDEGFSGLGALQPLDPTIGWSISTHAHSDHNAHHVLIGGRAIAGTGVYGPWQIERKASFHDEHGGRHRGGPVDLLRIEVDGYRIVHCGDLGELPGPDLLDWLREKPIDVLLVPAGGWFTLDAADAAELSRSLNPRVAVPFHCRDQGLPLPQLGRSELFLELWPEHDEERLLHLAHLPPAAAAPRIVSLRPSLSAHRGQ